MGLRTADELNDTGTVLSAIQSRDTRRASAFDSPLSGRRFSLAPREITAARSAGVRAVLKLDSGIGANATANEVTRRNAFDGKMRLVT